VPPRLARLARSASGQLADKWEELRASPTFGGAAGAASELARSVSERAGPHVGAALSKGRELTRSASAQISRVQSELTDIVETQMRATPALQRYADPVLIQAVVASILGAPLLLLLPLLAGLCSRRGGGDDAGGARRSGAAGSRRGAAAKAGPRQSARKIVRDGRDCELLGRGGGRQCWGEGAGLVTRAQGMAATGAMRLRTSSPHVQPPPSRCPRSPTPRPCSPAHAVSAPDSGAPPRAPPRRRRRGRAGPARPRRAVAAPLLPAAGRRSWERCSSAPPPAPTPPPSRRTLSRPQHCHVY
jgi:hypothetical protein